LSQPFADQVFTFNAILGAIEARVAEGEVPREVVADFKSSVDGLRLLSPRHEDLRPLAQAAGSLAGRIVALTS
jgi:hypothetical protein